MLPQMAILSFFGLGALNGQFVIFTLNLQIFCFCRHMWRCGNHLPTFETCNGLRKGRYADGGRDGPVNSERYGQVH